MLTSASLGTYYPTILHFVLRPHVTQLPSNFPPPHTSATPVRNAVFVLHPHAHLRAVHLAPTPVASPAPIRCSLYSPCSHPATMRSSSSSPISSATASALIAWKASLWLLDVLTKCVSRITNISASTSINNNAYSNTTSRCWSC